MGTDFGAKLSKLWLRVFVGERAEQRLEFFKFIRRGVARKGMVLFLFIDGTLTGANGLSKVGSLFVMAILCVLVGAFWDANLYLHDEHTKQSRAGT